MQTVCFTFITGCRYAYLASSLLLLLPTEHHSSEYEVFIHYYSQIVNSLSAVALSPYFVQEKIISTADQSLIFNTPVQTIAASLLLSKISCALRAGINESFYKFLDITEQHGSIDSKTVITAIRKKLKTEDKGNKYKYALS